MSLVFIGEERRCIMQEPFSQQPTTHKIDDALRSQSTIRHTQPNKIPTPMPKVERGQAFGCPKNMHDSEPFPLPKIGVFGVAIPANTSYLLLSEHALERMATILGDHAMAARRHARYPKGVEAMRSHMWDQSAGCFLAVQIETMQKIQPPAVGGFAPLLAHIPTRKQAEVMASTLTATLGNTAPHFRQ